MEKEENKLERIRLTFDDTLFNTLNVISLVDSPAVEQEAMLFSKENPKPSNFAFAKGDAEKQVITGVAMRANFDIYRYNWFLDKEYYVYFTPEDIEKAMQEFMKWSNNFATSFNHSQPLKDIYLFESWQVVDPETDKAKSLGFENISVGDWYVSFKVDNKEVWENLVKKYVKGFSIECWCTEILDKIEQKKQEPEMVDDEDLTEDQVKRLIESLSTPTPTKMRKISEISKWDIEVDQETIEVGTILTVTYKNGDETTTSHINDGEYVLEDGTKIQVDSDGKVVLITPPANQEVTE